MYQIELNYCKKSRKKLIIALSAIILIDIILIVILICDGGIVVNDVFKDIIISIISGVLPSIAVTIFIYYKYLKKSPKKQKQKLTNF